MTNKTISILSGVVIALALPLAQGAVRNANTSSVMDLANQSKAKTMLKQVESAAASVASEADHLHSLAENNYSREANLEALMSLRDEVNEMGKAISWLNGQRDSLTPTENHALDTLIPLAQSIASNTSHAIEYFNEGGPRVATGLFSSVSWNVFQDSQKIERTVSDSLKFEKLRTQEAKLQDRVQAEAEE
jgi:hypothetical protein